MLCEGGFARELVVRGAGGSGRVRARLVRWSAEELVLEVLGAEDGDFGQEELALDAVRVGVVEHGPNGDLLGGG